MAQVIEVPGEGLIEFPDDFNDDQIRNAVYDNFPDLRPEPEKSAESGARKAVGQLGVGSGAGQIGGAGLASGVFGLLRTVAETPATVGRGVNALGDTLYQVNRFLHNTLSPSDEPMPEKAPQLIDPEKDFLVKTFSQASQDIAKAQEILASESMKETGIGKPFYELAQINEKADKALTRAWENKSAKELLPILSDTRAWAGFIGQAVPSLLTAYASGGNLAVVGWLEGMEQATNAADFERMTGQKISDQEFVQAVAQAGLINGLLEKLGISKIIKSGEAKGLVGRFMAGLTSGAWEFGTELVQQFNTNIAEFLNYNPEKDLIEGVLPAGMGGFGAGATVGATQPRTTAAKQEAELTEAAKTIGEAERRVDVERRKQVAEMAPEEMRQALLTDELTGMPNRRAYNEAEKAPVQASVDVDGLKWVNDNLGHQSGDQLLQAVSQALQGETQDSYRISGDEFIVQAKTEAEANRALERVNKALEKATVEVQLPDGTVKQLVGAGVSYGIGSTLETAEQALQQSKAEREQAGLRAPRGEQPAGATTIAPTREPDLKSQPLKVKKVPGSTLHANPLPEIVKGYHKAVDKGLKLAHRAFFHKFTPLGKLPSRKDFLKLRYETLGKITSIDEIADKLYNSFRNLDTAQQKEVYHYMTTKDASPNSIRSPETRRAAIASKKLVNRVGRGLVNRGLLSQEIQEAHKDSYLPRVYLKHLLGESTFKALSGGKRISDLGYLKQRKDIPEDIRRIILGEITDPGFLASRGVAAPMRDMALLDFMTEIAKNENWIFPKSLVEYQNKKVSVQWLVDEAARLRKQAPYYPEEDAQKALAIAKEMDALSEPLLAELEKVPADYRQVPNSRRWGQLRGVWIRKEIYEDLIGVGQMIPTETSPAEWLLGYGRGGTKITQLWKMSKVALNPPTQVRNFVSNGVLLHLSGVPFHRVPQRMLQSISQIASANPKARKMMIEAGIKPADAKHWRIAQKLGILGGTFSANELFRIRTDILDLEARGHTKFSFATLKNIGGIISDKAGDAYQFSEAIFKTAKIIDAMEREGMSESDAALAAQEALYDYSLVPRSVRYLRNAPIGVPFLTFYYKTGQRLPEILLKHPQRFLPYWIIGSALIGYMADDNDVEKEDVEALQKALPLWLQDRGPALPLPYRDEYNRWQFVDVGYFLPWSMFDEARKDLQKGNVGEFIKTTGMLGGPIPDAIVAIKTNKDPFTQTDIINEQDPPKKQVIDFMIYTWRLLMPTWLTDVGFAGKMKQAITKEVDKFGDPKLTKMQAAARLVGVNIYPIEPKKTRFENLRRMNWELKEIQQRGNRRLRDKNLTREEKREIREEVRKLMKAQQKRIKEYREESKIHPRLQ